MNSNFTPGPWCIVSEVGADGSVYWYVAGDAFGDTEICGLGNPADATDADKANAQLIAAAPDLLAALLTFLVPAGEPDEKIRAQARAAVARATGETA